MAKKLILLMLVIPLILMISLYATSETVSLAIDIGVTGVSVTSDKFVEFDIDDYEEYKIDYTVYPTNAANKDVTFNVSQYEDYDLCELEIEDDIIKPLTTGYAKVDVTTNDGGFRDSIIVQVISREVTNLEITNKKALSQMFVGNRTKVDVLISPNEPSSKVIEYSSSNPNVLNVDSYGNIVALSRGEATISVKSSKYNVSDSINCIVLNRDVIDLANTNIDTFNQEGTLNISIDTLEEYDESNLNINFYDNDYLDANNKFTYSLLETSSGYTLNYKLNDEIAKDITYIVEVSLSLPSGLVRSVSCNLNFKSDYSISFTETRVVLALNQDVPLAFTINPTDIELDYEINKPSEVEARVFGNGLIVRANKLGIYELEVVADHDGLKKTCKVELIVAPRNINIVESLNTYGIANELVFGGGTNNLTLNLDDETYSLFKDYIKIVPYVNNKVTSLVKVSYDQANKNYDIVVDKSLIDSDVTFKVLLEYEDVVIDSYLSFTIKCLGNAKNVSNYKELKTALKYNHDVVLKNDILDFPLNPVLNEDYTLLPTTYDYTYYTNSGFARPTVKILLEVRSSIYGNGYEINAHNSTYEQKVDENKSLLYQNNPPFTGPLDFVKVGDPNGTTATASVKAQDNIFIGLYDNASLNNVVVKNCNDVNDLTYLDYMGTTVELLGDNCSINYSRISNARTVIRAFGDALDCNKIVHLNIYNSVLSNGRDFIMRIGSNKFKDGKLDPNNVNDMDRTSLYLDPSDIISIPFNDVNNAKSVQEYYESLDSNKKAEYDKKYITTYVTLSNVAFRNSGIFSIGLDSHFSGPALAGGTDFTDMLPYWNDLAKTSYGAKLIMDNTVNIYDWKELKKVDSSTLISTDIDSSDKDNLMNGFRLDVAKMVKSISDKPGFSDILYNDDTYKDYVHGGIAFFGGGYNYDVIEYGTNYNSYKLYGYKVGLDEVNTGSDILQQVLPLAAGDTDFYFLLCDSKTLAFTPKVQDELINSGEAYDFIIPKKG